MSASGQPASFPSVVVGAWQLSQGHHRKGMGLQEAIDNLTRILEGLPADQPLAIDCADIYTGVEERLGTLRAHLRGVWGAESLGRLRIHTKLVPDRSALGEVDRGYVTRIVDRSLQRLGVERLDLVQFAWWDYSVPGYLDCLGWLDELRHAGKVARVGVTNFDEPRLREILDSGVPVVSNQVQYSALDHRPAGSMNELCAERGVALLAYGALAGGFLSDRWRGADDPAPGGLEDIRALPSRSLTKYRLVIEEFGGWSRYQALLDRLASVGRSHGASTAQAAVAYALSRPGVQSIILGLTDSGRFLEAAAGAALKLGSREQALVHDLAERAPGPTGPVFGLEREPGGPHAAIMKYDLNQGVEVIG